MRLGLGLRLSDILRANAAPKSSLVTGLVSYWTLDEVSGTRADAVGDNDLTDNNTTGYDTGVNGNAASFVAANSESLSNASIVDTPSYSVSLWFKTPASYANFHGIFALGAGNYPNSVLNAYLDANGFIWLESWYGGADQLADRTDALPTNTWFHLVMDLDATGNVAHWFLNGPVTANGTGSGAAGKITVDRIGIGTLIGGNYYNSLIDEVAIWSRVLTADEIAALYNSGDGVTYPFVGVSLP